MIKKQKILNGPVFGTPTFLRRGSGHAFLPRAAPHHVTHLFGWTRQAKFRSPADIFSPFGKGGSRGICLSGGEVFVPAQRRCFGTMEPCRRNKSPITPLSQRGVKNKLQSFQWSRKIYGVLCTRRVQTTLIGNDQASRGDEGGGISVLRVWICFGSQSKNLCVIVKLYFVVEDK